MSVAHKTHLGIDFVGSDFVGDDGARAGAAEDQQAADAHGWGLEGANKALQHLVSKRFGFERNTMSIHLY
jgi:hypothetical protein